MTQSKKRTAALLFMPDSEPKKAGQQISQEICVISEIIFIVHLRITSSNFLVFLPFLLFTLN
jgi:hypothetical protein